MSFPLANNPIADKLRQEMYLKHLRQVQRINNRQADSLKKEITSYKNITDLHKKNKLKANERKQKEHQKSIEMRNLKIFKKIMAVESDQQLRHSQNPESSFWKSSCKQSSLKNSELQVSTARSYDIKKSLHYRYRKKQQQRIDRENQKMMKAISLQKSALLPTLQRSKRIQSSSIISSHKSKENLL